MRYSIVIISIYALIITVNAINAKYKNPICTGEHTNPKLNTTEPTLLVFAIGYDTVGQDKEKIAYVVRQTACWIPNHDNISSVTFFHLDLYNVLAGTKDVKTTLTSITRYSQATDPVSCDKFGEGLQTLNKKDVSDYESIKVIAHARLINDTCDYALKWKNANFSSKFEFFLIRFDDKKDDAYISLNYEDVNSINVNDTSPTEPLKKATGTFMNYVIGVDKPPKVEKTPAPEEKDYTIWIIIGVISLIVAIVAVIGVLLCWHQKLCCFKKKKNRQNGSKAKGSSKQKKGSSKPSNTTEKKPNAAVASPAAAPVPSPAAAPVAAPAAAPVAAANGTSNGKSAVSAPQTATLSYKSRADQTDDSTAHNAVSMSNRRYEKRNDQVKSMSVENPDEPFGPQNADEGLDHTQT